LSRLKPVKAERVVKALSKLGFQIARQKGSPLVMKHPNGRITVVPIHGGDELGRGILRQIAHDVKVGSDEFIRIQVVFKSIEFPGTICGKNFRTLRKACAIAETLIESKTVRIFVYLSLIRPTYHFTNPLCSLGSH
jgi:predicted RNA binding protein YcfA (HicA-like mRNA interferase family)